MRACLYSAELRRVVLSVIVARCMKQTLDQRMRELMFQVRVPSDEPFKRLACQFFNSCFESGNEAACSNYWTSELKADVERRFPHALTDEEKAPGYDLRRSGVSRSLLSSIVLFAHCCLLLQSR